MGSPGSICGYSDKHHHLKVMKDISSDSFGWTGNMLEIGTDGVCGHLVRKKGGKSRIYNNSNFS